MSAFGRSAIRSRYTRRRRHKSEIARVQRDFNREYFISYLFHVGDKSLSLSFKLWHLNDITTVPDDRRKLEEYPRIKRRLLSSLFNSLLVSPTAGIFSISLPCPWKFHYFFPPLTSGVGGAAEEQCRQKKCQTGETQRRRRCRRR